MPSMPAPAPDPGVEAPYLRRSKAVWGARSRPARRGQLHPDATLGDCAFPSLASLGAVAVQAPATVVETDWRIALPVLTGAHVTLRELRQSDAASLFAMLTTEEVARFISPPPSTIEGFERFIAWTLRERAAGRYICFAVVPKGRSSAVGLFQVRQLEPSFMTAEWGFAIGSSFWGTGVFVDAARLVVDFVFESVGVHRLEARAAVANGRGNGALLKLGAVEEGILRKSFQRHGQYLDQCLWSIIDDDWRRARAVDEDWRRSRAQH